MAESYKKDPAAVLDFGVDLNGLLHGRAGAKSNWLAAGETVSSFTVTAEAGLTVQSPSQSGGLITFWLSNGEAGQSYQVTCTWTTSAGRTDRRKIVIEVDER